MNRPCQALLFWLSFLVPQVISANVLSRLLIDRCYAGLVGRFIVHAAVASCRGSILGNQDRALVKWLPDGRVIAGVFDGYGTAGNFIATFAQQRASGMIEKNETSFGSLNLLYKDMQEYLAQFPAARHSGTTAAFAIFDQTHAWISHIGDSRVVLERNGAPIFETRPHNFLCAIEKERARERGINKAMIPRGVIAGMVSRSWGDLRGHRLKLFEASPDIARLPTHYQDGVILGTAGLFSNLSTEQVLQFIYSWRYNSSPTGNVAQDLIERAQAESHNLDDMTAVLLVPCKFGSYQAG